MLGRTVTALQAQRPESSALEPTFTKPGMRPAKWFCRLGHFAATPNSLWKERTTSAKLTQHSHETHVRTVRTQSDVDGF